VRILKENGYTEISNLTGGWVSLETEGGFDVEKS
jgi:rhodanese-related sulfurtransferase